MSEQHPTPENQSPSLQEKIDQLKKEKVVDISEGFPVQDKHELLDLIMHFFKENQGRFPIIGAYDAETGSIRTFILFNPQGQIQHRELWELMTSRYPEKQFRCAFTTGIKGFSSRREKPCLVLEDVRIPDEKDFYRDMFLPLQEGSDLATANTIFKAAHPVDKDFTAKGRQVIADIFSQLDIEVDY